ncbi:MAG TPA: DUF433 domain-containing protein [Chloroflexota bacterium]|jgi:uncharacterized protein (DUF433 family)
MAIAVKAESLPLKVDQDGVMRVGGTRIPIDRVVYEFNTGATPEEIVLRYDTLRLDDVYFAIGYYLRHKTEVDAYLAEREREAQENIAKIEAKLSWSEVRARLLARMQRSEDSSPRDR